MNHESKNVLIEVIEINVAEKKISEVKIENAASLIRKKMGFKRHSEVFFGETMACLITGSDENPNQSNYFEINGIAKKFYNSGVVVRAPKNYNMERLLKCNITLEGLQKMVRFSE